LFYESEFSINVVCRDSQMGSGIVIVNKAIVSCHAVLLDYGDEAKLRLRSNTGRDFTRGGKRGRTEIMAEILFCCSQRKTKTSIMYDTNLNYAQLKKYLGFLTSKDLLVADNNTYAITQTGQRFLTLFVQLNKMLGS
jgi:predicted transcriptional regulator